MRNKFSLFKAAGHLIFCVFCLFCILPMILVVAISFSNENDIVNYGYRLIPHNFDFSAYSFIFSDASTIIKSYLVTITVTVCGSILGLLMVTSLAYGISRKDFKYRNIISFYVFFTMLFGGGLVPWYILITKYLHIGDSLLVLILPYAVNVWFVMLMKGFLQNISAAIIESAKIDGASELRILFTIIMPISKPALATVGLFYALNYWNDWWLSLLFIDNKNLYPLQFLLYKVLTNIETLSSMKSSYGIDVRANLPTHAVRMATAILAAGPMLFVFPFFQRYFVKGLTVGAVKG